MHDCRQTAECIQAQRLDYMVRAGQAAWEFRHQAGTWSRIRRRRRTFAQHPFYAALLDYLQSVGAYQTV